MCESVCSIDFTPKILPPCSDRESAVLLNSVAELEDCGEEQLVIMRCLLLEEKGGGGGEPTTHCSVTHAHMYGTQGRGGG